MKIRLQFDFKLISKDNEKIMGRNGRYFLSSKFKDFENKIKYLSSLQYKGKPLVEDLHFNLVVGFKNKVHADCTNLFKGVCDALQGICYRNDRQIKYAECIIYEDMPIDSFIVIIEPYIMQSLTKEEEK